jgi:peptidoglycan/LPS O-acetylase OafA/YrhL
LDGVRGVAILLVLGQHSPTKPLANGYVGVTVFFCLSGYLITTLLVRELDTGTIDLRGFYRRRVARLGPGLVTVVAVTTVILLIDRQDLGVWGVLAPAVTALLYATSIYDWTGHFFATYDYFNYTWSLSVEEQFYLLWPFVLLWGYLRHRRLLVVLVVTLTVFSLGLNLYLGLSRAIWFDAHEYVGTDVNALPILVGSLLAIMVHNDWLPRTLRYVAPTALVALPLLFALAARNDIYRTSLVRVGGTALTLVILIGVVKQPRSVTGSLLSTPPMRWLGERSYSIYLWNVLARITVLHEIGHTGVGDLAYVTMFVVLAEASFRLVERPLRAKLGRRPGVSPPQAPRPDPTPLGNL